MTLLQVHHDGKLVFTGEVQSKRQVFAVMGEFPPPHARGSVVSLVNGKRREVVALSRHSTHGPTWGMA